MTPLRLLLLVTLPTSILRATPLPRVSVRTELIEFEVPYRALPPLDANCYAALEQLSKDGVAKLLNRHSVETMSSALGSAGVYHELAYPTDWTPVGEDQRCMPTSWTVRNLGSELEATPRLRRNEAAEMQALFIKGRASRVKLLKFLDWNSAETWPIPVPSNGPIWQPFFVSNNLATDLQVVSGVPTLVGLLSRWEPTTGLTKSVESVMEVSFLRASVGPVAQGAQQSEPDQMFFQCEAFVLPAATALAMLWPAGEDAEIYEELQPLLENGGARRIFNVGLRADPDTSAHLQNIGEFPYPTDFDSNNERRIPTLFNVRIIGAGMELKWHRNAMGAVSAECRISQLLFPKISAWPTDGPAEAALTEFSNFEYAGEIPLRGSGPQLLGALLPSAAIRYGYFSDQAMVLLFAHATFSKPSPLVALKPQPHLAAFSVSAELAEALRLLIQENGGDLKNVAMAEILPALTSPGARLISYGAASGTGKFSCAMETALLDPPDPKYAGTNWSVESLGTFLTTTADVTATLKFHSKPLPPRTRELSLRLATNQKEWLRLAGEIEAEVPSAQLPPSGKFHLVRIAKLGDTGQWELILAGVR